MLERLGHYQILGRLGAGGMGIVFRALDTRLGRHVAVKVLADPVAADPEHVERLRREARALAALDHPNVVSVYSVEEADGRHFITMGLVEGEALDARIARGPLACEEVTRIGRAIAAGLAVTHARGVVHRDLKPGNVMLDANGGVKVLDFGLARMRVEQPEALALTAEDTTPGTVPYMAPEQFGGSEASPSSDVFALGVTLYEMATGRLPFAGATVAEVITAILHEPPPPLDGIPDALAAVIERCLSRDPSDRPADASAVLASWQEEGQAVLRAASTCLMEGGEPPSLAIPPFRNLGEDVETGALADGVWLDLHAELVRLSGLVLVSSITTETLRGVDIDPRHIGRTFDVRHVLVGTFRRGGSRARITMELIETESAMPVWAERFDRELDDILGLSDEITRHVVGELDAQLLYGSWSRASRATFRTSQTLGLFYQAIPLAWSPRLQDIERAYDLLARIREQEPENSLAYQLAGWARYMEVHHGLARDPEACIAEAEVWAAQALERGDADGMASMLVAVLRHMKGDHEGAFEAGQTTLARRPGCPWAFAVQGNLCNYAGRPQDAIELARRAARLTPITPPLFPAVMARAFYQLGEYETAIAVAEETLERYAESLDAQLVRAAAGVAMGDRPRVDEAVAAVRRARADFQLDAYLARWPYRHDEERERFRSHLVEAGL